MDRIGRWGSVALLSGLVGWAFVACQTARPDTAESGNPSAPGAGSESPVDAAPPGPPVDHALLVDSQRARIMSAEIAADKRTQYVTGRLRHQTQMRLHPETMTPNFTVTTGAPVVGALGIYAASFTSESASDEMFFGVQGSGTGAGITSASVCTGTCANDNFFALTNIYGGAPTLAWSTTVSSGTSAAVAFSGTGSQLFVMSNGGTLYCFQAVGGSTCSGWTNPTISITGSGITPWVDSVTNAVYVNDGNGNLYRFNATTGAQVWSVAYTGVGSKAWPAESDNVVYLGDGIGRLWRIVDPNTGAAPTSISSATLAGGNCTSTVSVDGSISLDTTANLAFIPYNGCMMTLPHYCATCTKTTGTWSVTSRGWSASVPNKTTQTWPTLDGSYAYWISADKPTGATPTSAVWKTPYSTATVKGSNLVNSTGTGATVTAAPVVWAGNLYVGDESGYVEAFGCASSLSSSTSFLAETNAQGGAVNTPIVLDDSTGNIEYGFTNGTAGGVAQFPLWESGAASAFTWNCPSGMVACANQLCGTGTNKVECVPTGQCSTGTACSTVAAAGATIQVGAAASEGVYVTGTQGDAGTLICPNGTVINGILGASYGTPPSNPDNTLAGNTFDFSACYGNNSLSVTGSECPLNTSQNCTFDSYNGTFGDPCVGTGKNYYAWFACSAAQDGGTLPTFCSRQNVTPSSGSDPCIPSTDGGVAYCSGTCLTGWGDCNSNLQYDGCETNVKGTDPANCGSCAHVCTAGSNASATCTAGACGFACNSGYVNCTGTCTSESGTNCGTCGNTCNKANESGVCTTSTCACNTNFGNCDGNAANGCEADLTSTTANCGACGTNCTTNVAHVTGGVSCSASACTYSGSCSTGYGDCDGNAANGCETNLYASATCGTCGSTTNCGTALAHTTGAACTTGTCTYTSCAAGYGDCDGNSQNGCETNLNSTTSCGTCAADLNCNLTVANANTIACSSEVCTYGTCKANYQDCNSVTSDGCESNKLTDNNNCGGCGTVCASSTNCVNGSCVQSQTFTVSSTFTVPTGVTSISIVTVGGGGGGSTVTSKDASGGGGGALCYLNAYAVTAGSTFTVTVGAGGALSTSGTGGTGGTTSVKTSGGTIIVNAAGGSGGISSTGSSGTISGGVGGTSSLAGTTCWPGGAGGSVALATGATTLHAGGGGAAGYLGAGGVGGASSSSSCGTAPTSPVGNGGGAGGGSGTSTSVYSSLMLGGSGGGVGLFGVANSGTVGSNYCATSNTAGVGSPGGGGSTDSAGGGASALGTGGAGGSAGTGGLYGGGGGSAAGGGGAVRIIWGPNPDAGTRSFPYGAYP